MRVPASAGFKETSLYKIKETKRIKIKFMFFLNSDRDIFFSFFLKLNQLSN